VVSVKGATRFLPCTRRSKSPPEKHPDYPAIFSGLDKAGHPWSPRFFSSSFRIAEPSGLPTEMAALQAIELIFPACKASR